MVDCLWKYDIEAKIIALHISNVQGYPVKHAYFIAPIYVITTIAPALFSRVKRMGWLGVAILLFYALTKIGYTYYIVSVRCFLAPIFSIEVFMILYKMT